MMSLNLHFRRILQGGLFPAVFKPFSHLLIFLFLFVACYSHAYALTLSGTVYGGGTPLADVTLSLTDQSSGSSVGNATSGVDGNYNITVSDGTYTLTVTPQVDSGFDESIINDITISGVNKLLDVYLVPNSVTLNGTVYLPDGVTPASNVQLKIYNAASPSNYLNTVTTNASGMYSFTVSPGMYGLYMLIDTNSNAGLVGVFRSDKYLTNIDLSVDRSQDIILPFVSISGRTVDSNGVPVGNVGITVNQIQLPNINNGIVLHGQGTLASDASGNYAFSIYPHSSYSVNLVPPTNASGVAATALTNVDLSVNDNTRDFQLQHGSVLSGTIYLPDGTTPASNVQLKIYNTASPSNYLNTVTTNASGMYSFTVSPGTYGLYMLIDTNSNVGLVGGFRSDKYITNIDLSVDRSQDITLPFVSISGRTVDSNGVPVGNVDITVNQIQLPNINNGIVLHGQGALASDASGNYAFSIYPHSSYSVNLVPPINTSGVAATALTNVDLSVNDNTRDFQLQHGSVLSGTVYLPDGTTPASNVQLKIYNTASPSNYLNTVTTNASGMYSFTVPPGMYGLYMLIDTNSNAGLVGVFRSDKYITNIDLSVDRSQDITLPFVSISGRTLDSNGVPVGNVDITVNQIQLPNINNGIVLHGQGTLASDASGNYAFSIYPYVSYTVNINPPAGSGFSNTFFTGIDYGFNKSQIFVLPHIDVRAPIIVAGPYVKTITDTTAVVEWQTDEPATSDVIINGVTMNVAGKRTHHSVPLIGLTASTAYSAQASSYDNAGNGPVFSAAVNFTTLSTPDTTVPSIINGPVITGITQNRVLIQWTTSEPTTTALTYGETSPTTPVSIAGLRETHELEITGLSPSTQYVVQVQATDSAGNGPVSSSIVDFLTAALVDTQPPVIVAGPMVTNITDTEITVEWETDEPSVSGVSSNNGTVYNVYRDDNLTTQHKIRVTSLIPGTPYYYTVSSTDEFGNGPTLSAEKQFTTNDTIDVDSPMVIEPLKVVGITHKSAVIHWRTDEPADSVIEFGSSAATLSRIESDTKLKQKHVLHLVDLAADTEYFFRANSTDSSGNKVATDISSFRTRTHPDTAKPAFPVSPSVIGQTDTTATIYWETDKPSECVVEYGVGQSKTNRRSLSGKSTKHQVTLAGLLPNETYSFVVSSTDASGNRSEHSSVAQVAQVETSRNKGMFATVVDWFVEQAIAEGDVATGFSTNAIPDTTAPSITIEPEVVSSASEYIVLRWVTDEPAYSRAEFNLYGGTLGRVIGDINYNTEHLMVLPNLTSNTAYDVQVFSVDAAGNEVASSIQTVVSGAQADVQEPVFTIAPAVNVVSDTEVIAIWGTDEYTISELECVSTGTTSTWQVSVEGLRKHHTLHLNGLEAGPEYECQVSSQDISGNKVNSGIATVRTAVQSTNPAGSGVDNNPNPSVDLVSTTTTEPNVAPSVSGGGSLNPLYLLFMTAYFVAFSRYRRKY